MLFCIKWLPLSVVLEMSNRILSCHGFCSKSFFLYKIHTRNRDKIEWFKSCCVEMVSECSICTSVVIFWFTVLCLEKVGKITTVLGGSYLRFGSISSRLPPSPYNSVYVCGVLELRCLRVRCQGQYYQEWCCLELIHWDGQYYLFVFCQW